MQCIANAQSIIMVWSLDDAYAGHLDLSKHSIKIGVPARWAGSALPSLPKLRYVLPLLKGML